MQKMGLSDSDAWEWQIWSSQGFGFLTNVGKRKHFFQRPDLGARPRAFPVFLKKYFLLVPGDEQCCKGREAGTTISGNKKISCYCMQAVWAELWGNSFELVIKRIWRRKFKEIMILRIRISGGLSSNANICWSGRVLYCGVLGGGFGLLVIGRANYFLPPWVPNGRDWAASGHFCFTLGFTLGSPGAPPGLPPGVPPWFPKNIPIRPQVYISGAKMRWQKCSWNQFRYFWRSGGVRENGGSV